MQVKLLRVLQERVVERIGSQRELRVDIPSSPPPTGTCRRWWRGRFRLDLFYRLNVVPVRLPSLRERPGDIRRWCAFTSTRSTSPTAATSACPRHVHGPDGPPSRPGNVRQLRNVLERMVLLAAGNVVVEAAVVARHWKRRRARAPIAVPGAAFETEPPGGLRAPPARPARGTRSASLPPSIRGGNKSRAAQRWG